MKETTRHSLKACLPADRLFWQESLAEHTSFRCGGPAACLARVINTEELRQVLRLLREEDEAHFVLGRGTNVLADDAGYEGVIVQVAEGFDDIRREGDTIVAEGGAPLMRAAAFARDCGLSGLEFACGIPGTVGGGVVMNAGAYGGEMCRMVESAVLLLEDGTERICSTKELEFGIARVC